MLFVSNMFEIFVSFGLALMKEKELCKKVMDFFFEEYEEKHSFKFSL